MNSDEKLFHFLVLGAFVAILFVMSFLFVKQDNDKREKLFHGLLGVLSLGTLFLIFVGGMVASTRSGMAFMDWPTSNGLIWPSMDKWIHQKDMFWEHIHRLIAEGVGYLAICTLIWSFFVHGKKYVKLSMVLLLLIILQGIFGGLTVKRLTAWWTSSLHGVVAQLVFCLMVLLYVKTGKSFKNLKQIRYQDSWLGKIPAIVCAAVFLQLVLGASFRHKMKQANFSSEVPIQDNRANITFRKSGTYTIKVKAKEEGNISLSLDQGGELYSSISKKISSAEVGEDYLTLGSVEVLAGKALALNGSLETLDSLKFVGPERIDSLVEGSKQELPFTIVYREVLEGNRHLLFAHMGFAVIVTFLVLYFAMLLPKKKEEAPLLNFLSRGMLGTLFVQLALGLIAYLAVTQRQKGIYDQTKTILTSAHLANGAVLLAFCVTAWYFTAKAFEKTSDEGTN